MTSAQTSQRETTWGENLNIITVSDFGYLPGVYALFNSAVLNGFKGTFYIFLHPGVDSTAVVSHPQIKVADLPEGFSGVYCTFTLRLAAFPALPPGQYLYLDADIIIERPCGHLVAPISSGILVSPEPESKYDVHDAIVHEQCSILQIPAAELASFPYVNAGLLGYELPRDQDFVDDLYRLSRDHLRSYTKMLENPKFPFLDQDILNMLVRKRQKQRADVFSVSPKVLEFSRASTLFQSRPFPYTRQGDLQPADQIKYIIHGASLRRPWLKPGADATARRRLVYFLELMGLRAIYGRPTPYERAWAYYACSADLPIPISAWADRHKFIAHKSPLWRLAYGL